MNKSYMLAAIITVGSVGAALIGGLGKIPDARIVKYATKLDERGVKHQVIFQKIADKFQLDVEEVKPVARRAWGKHGRDPDTARIERMAIGAGVADAPVVNAVIASAMCQGLADEGDDEYAACMAAESQSLSEPYCRTTNGNLVWYGAQVSVTRDEREAIIAGMDALDPALQSFKIRNATHDDLMDKLAQKNLERCPEPAP